MKDATIFCSSLGPTRGSHTARALRARRDCKLTSRGMNRTLHGRLEKGILSSSAESISHD